MAVSISVIIPVYNKAKYLRECIDSLLNQTHSDYEVLCINDGSTDNSLEILNSYNDSRLKVISVPNGGVSRARNIGIDTAAKDFITFVDSDDFVAPEFLERLSQEVEKTQCNVLLSGLVKFTENGAEGSVAPSFAEGAMNIADFKNCYVREMVSNAGVLGYVAAKIVHRSYVNNNTIRFNTELKLAEDLDFWLSVYLAESKVVGISHYAGYYYRQGTENSSVDLPPQCLSQIEIWKRILNTIAIDDQKGRLEVHKKILGYAEAHMLQLNNFSYRNVKIHSEVLYNVFQDIVLKADICNSLLQKMIARKQIFMITAYLTVRCNYHRICH